MNEQDLTKEISYYQAKISKRTEKEKKNHEPDKLYLEDKKKEDSNQIKNDSFIEIQKLFVEAMTDERINNDEKIKESFKKNVEYYIMHEFNSEAISAIDKIFKYNPERNIKNENDDSFIFNCPLKSNGKTLIYLACQEGKIEILNYFLDKGLNPKIPSVIDNGVETPIECACRWGYSQIVQCLISRVSYTKRELQKCKKINGISKNIIKILNEKIDSLNENVCCW